MILEIYLQSTSSAGATMKPRTFGSTGTGLLSSFDPFQHLHGQQQQKYLVPQFFKGFAHAAGDEHEFPILYILFIHFYGYLYLLFSTSSNNIFLTLPVLSLIFLFKQMILVPFVLETRFMRQEFFH